ncbi:MAG: aldehyde dehydrogenase family protein, partial [Candidatus Macondimonas sp.]
MSIPVLPCYVANRPVQTDDRLPVRDKYHGSTRWEVSRADAALMEAAIAGAVQAAPAMARMRPHARQAILRHCL